MLRTDAGTENSLLARIQPMLRHEHTDSFSKDKSHIYGRSTSNQVQHSRCQYYWIHLHPNNCLVIIAISNERILQPSFLENRGMVVSITPTLHGVVDNFF